MIEEKKTDNKKALFVAIVITVAIVILVLVFNLINWQIFQANQIYPLKNKDMYILDLSKEMYANGMMRAETGAVYFLRPLGSSDMSNAVNGNGMTIGEETALDLEPFVGRNVRVTGKRYIGSPKTRTVDAVYPKEDWDNSVVINIRNIEIAD